MDIQLSPHAIEIERSELEAYRTRLLIRANEYAANKRADERERIRRKLLRPETRIDFDLQQHDAPVRQPTELTSRRQSTGSGRGKAHAVNGVAQTIAQWAASIGISASGLHHAIKRHGSLEAALNQRPRQRHVVTHVKNPGGGRGA